MFSGPRVTGDSQRVDRFEPAGWSSSLSASAPNHPPHQTLSRRGGRRRVAGRELSGMDIHIQRDGQQMGPYTLEQINEYLTQGALLATDSAWHEGMIEWVQIGRVQGVTIPGKPAVPAVGASCPQCQSSVEDDQVICVKCGHRLKLEDPMEQTMTSHIWEDSPTVPKYDNKKIWVGVSAGSSFLSLYR